MGSTGSGAIARSQCLQKHRVNESTAPSAGSTSSNALSPVCNSFSSNSSAIQAAEHDRQEFANASPAHRRAASPDRGRTQLLYCWHSERNNEKGRDVNSETKRQEAT